MPNGGYSPRKHFHGGPAASPWLATTQEGQKSLEVTPCYPAAVEGGGVEDPGIYPQDGVAQGSSTPANRRT